MRPVGIHVRIRSSLKQLKIDCERLGLSAVQFFLVHEPSGTFIKTTEADRALFRSFVDTTSLQFFIHASYVVNPASERSFAMHNVFRRELTLAEHLGINNVVVHPGSYHKAMNYSEGIDRIAEFVMATLTRYPTITLLLENVAFASPSIGGNWEDFQAILERVNYHERLAFCVDVAHAHSYGYDLLSENGRQNFVTSIEQTLGASRIRLLHLNDTTCERGSRIDKHAVPGAGMIGKNALHALAQAPIFRSIPIIVETPQCMNHEETDLINWLMLASG